MKATCTYMTFLMHKNGNSYEKLIDVRSFPDIGQSPEMLETTTLSDRMQTYIAGIMGSEAMTFETNYNKEGYTALAALRNKTESYAVWFGGEEQADGTVTPTGEEGKFSFDGQLSVRVKGGGVNEVRGMEISIAPSTVIVEE